MPLLVVARFIDGVLEILVENQITVLKDLHKFKFEYMTWPSNVEGMRHVACNICGVGLCHSIEGMKKAFVCEVLDAYAKANPVEPSAAASVTVAPAVSEELRFDLFACSFGHLLRCFWFET